MEIKSVDQFTKALDYGPYAWPGGYPLYFICSDGEALSFSAAKENKDLIIDSIKSQSNDGWRVTAIDINWEDANLICAHTGDRIPSAYAEE